VLEIFDVCVEIFDGSPGDIIWESWRYLMCVLETFVRCPGDYLMCVLEICNGCTIDNCWVS